MTNSEINIWSWEKVPPHLNKYLYAGRLFCFEFDKNTYCFGRIMTKTLVGYIAEFFDRTSPLPEFSEELLNNSRRVDVEVINTQDLFERNTKKTWRIIGDQRNYVPENIENINYRLGGSLKKVDFFGKVSDISETEAKRLPLFVPLGETEIKQILASKLGLKYAPGKTPKRKTGTEIWGWDKKPRTMLRYIDAGMIFCFKLDESNYCFGRIMTKYSVGHIAEFFDHTSSEPVIDEDILNSLKRISVQIIDSYSLFDRRSEGEWRIIGACHNYIPNDVENIIFYYGIGSGTRLTDFFDHKRAVSVEEAKKYPPLSPYGDYLIKKEIADKL